VAEEKAEELKISNETKNKLLSILAHDLRVTTRFYSELSGNPIRA
jgi:hypothetical protein